MIHMIHIHCVKISNYDKKLDSDRQSKVDKSFMLQKRDKITFFTIIYFIKLLFKALVFLNKGIYSSIGRYFQFLD